MRAYALACLLLTLAAPAVAADRYGAQTAAPMSPATDAPVARLSWPGKVNPTAPQAAVSAAPARLPDGALRRTSNYSAPVPAPAVAANPAAAPVENAPWKRLTGTATPLPAATPAAMEEAQPAPPARPVTQVAAAAPLPAAQSNSAAASGEQAKFYSLHREYGETPDAIPAPQKSQVFLAGGPLASGVGEDADIDRAEGDTGRTAALNKARLAADWAASNAK
jgi:hypothetical protein